MREKEKRRQSAKDIRSVLWRIVRLRGILLAHTGGGARRSSWSKNARIMACDGNRSPRDFSKGLMVS